MVLMAATEPVKYPFFKKVGESMKSEKMLKTCKSRKIRGMTVDSHH